ncbi:methylglyoxal reductase (NADPH-dependent) gre2 [Diaporthe australafricana]|uniref:Methylglyoxal reductase (NADPH-dependent) gre2 n=1 Tax=Diaporthe australafricana TaxID=127596 RepID=A0ABR3WZS8_9PEZI
MSSKPSEMTDSPKERVLLTGGSGFIASHVLDALLAQGFSVVVTARSPEKGQAIVDSIDESLRPDVSFAVVEDVAQDGAFDPVFQSGPTFDYVIHTASPYSFKVDDPVKDFLDPAIKGTTGILRSIKAHAPSVRRVVITSSSAAIINPLKHEKVYDESKWAPFTWQDALSSPQFGYPASKKLAEQAAWEFVNNETPSFDLATICNTYTFGPVQRQLPSLDSINTSNQRIRDLALGRMRAGLEPTAPVFTWVDVRDVALAHVRAVTRPAAGGSRFYVVGGYFSNKRLADIIRARHPGLAGRLPPEEEVRDDFPEHVYGFDNRRSREVLGLEYRTLEDSVGDTVASILEWQSRH